MLKEIIGLIRCKKFFRIKNFLPNTSNGVKGFTPYINFQCSTNKNAKGAGSCITGFTLVEVLVAVIILVLVVGAVFGGYVLSQRAFRGGETLAELTQNGRVVLERMTREVRQAREMVTDLPENQEEATTSIEFEDGHVEERYRYIRYFLEGNEVKREVRGYVFAGPNGGYVSFKSVSEEGQIPGPVVIEEAQIIGEFAQDLKFWGPEIRIIGVFIALQKGDRSVDFLTKIFGRNL